MSYKAVEDRQYNKIWTYGMLYPQICNVLVRWLPVTLLLYLFGKQGGEAIANMPGWLNNAFGMMSRMLPGVGLCLCISIMGMRSLVPYCIIGFFLVGRFKFMMVEVAVIGIVLGMLHTLLALDDDDYDDEDDEEYVPLKGRFSTRDIVWWYYKYSSLYRQSQCMEYFYGTGNAMVMMTEMKRIYGDDEDGLQKGMFRALDPYITHPSTGSWMLTAQLAMEEDIAVNGDPDGNKGTAITSLKTGFMGPFAGIGDTIWGSVGLPIVRSFAYAQYLTGSWTGYLYSFVYGTISGMVTGITSSIIGYKAGLGTIIKVIATPIFKRVLIIAIIVGMTTMGALSASYVSVKTTMTFEQTITTTDDSGKQAEALVQVPIQEKLDQIMPNLLTFLYMALMVWMQFSSYKTTTMMLVSVAIATVGAILRIW